MIGGNTESIIQVNTSVRNEIGETVKVWHDLLTLRGWLDLSSGESRYTTYNAKIQESTHIFICNYMTIPDTFVFEGKTVNVNAEKTRMIANSKLYDIMLIDDPMELHEQLEIYLKYTGG